MKNVQLKKLELTNYRNIEYAIYEFNGNSKIVGDNRIGKTNTLEAIYYLLTGYLLNGSSDIQAIKPLKDQRAIVSVKGTFDVDGKTITLEKKFFEEWVKPRGQMEEVLKGHATELYYNEVKQPTQKDYDALFNEDFGITQSETVKISFTQMLTNPFYIGDLCDTGDWQEVRKFIIELVGDVKDEDVFAKEPMTAVLKPELELANGRLDQVKKKVDGEIKGLKETLIADDAKVEMLSKIEKPSDAAIMSAKAELNSIDEQIIALRSKNGTSQAEIELKNKIADLTVQIANEKAKAVPTPVNNSQRERLLNEKYEIQSKISSCKSKIETLNFEKTNLLTEYTELKNTKIEVQTVCPTCKRPLDPSQIEEAKKNLADEIKTKMDVVVLEGTKKKNEIETLTRELAEHEQTLDKISSELNSIVDETPIAPTENTKVKELETYKTQLETDLSNLKLSEEKARQEVNTQIYELEQKKPEFQKVLDDLAYFERQTQEQEKCKAERTTHEKELVVKEQMKDMIAKYTYTKLQMLDANVSKVFGNIKFQLIKPNLNGGFDTVCKPYIYDTTTKTSTNVLWKSGSKSERVATGIAIVEAIKTKLGLANMPYLFDEGGELSSDTIKTRLATTSQIICVKVQDNLTAPMVMAL